MIWLAKRAMSGEALKKVDWVSPHAHPAQACAVPSKSPERKLLWNWPYLQCLLLDSLRRSYHEGKPKGLEISDYFRTLQAHFAPLNRQQLEVEVLRPLEVAGAIVRRGTYIRVTDPSVFRVSIRAALEVLDSIVRASANFPVGCENPYFVVIEKNSENLFPWQVDSNPVRDRVCQIADQSNPLVAQARSVKPTPPSLSTEAFLEPKQPASTEPVTTSAWASRLQARLGTDDPGIVAYLTTNWDRLPNAVRRELLGPDLIKPEPVSARSLPLVNLPMPAAEKTPVIRPTVDLDASAAELLAKTYELGFGLPDNLPFVSEVGSRQTYDWQVLVGYALSLVVSSAMPRARAEFIDVIQKKSGKEVREETVSILLKAMVHSTSWISVSGIKRGTRYIRSNEIEARLAWAILVDQISRRSRRSIGGPELMLQDIAEQAKQMAASLAPLQSKVVIEIPIERPIAKSVEPPAKASVIVPRVVEPQNLVPRATSHEPRATSHEPRATSHEPRGLGNRGTTGLAST